MRWDRSIIFIALVCISHALAAEPASFTSHAPMRALPAPSTRPAAEGGAYFVDPKVGDDAAGGNRANPWRTIQHGVDQLKPGDTLYLGGGIYYENVRITGKGAVDRP